MPTTRGVSDRAIRAGSAGGPARPPGALPPPADPSGATPFQHAVLAVVGGLAPGEAMTYAEVAAEAGHPGAGQAVANVLRRFEGLPWWRVVPSTGRLYRTHSAVQGPLLETEGFTVGEDRVVRRAGEG